jgi:TonB-dependent receptor
MKQIVTFLFILLIAKITFGQGTVRGKLTDNNGESLIGARVVLKSNPAVGTITDFDGNYSIKIADSIAQTLVYSYISFVSKEEIFQLKKGEILVKNVELSSNSTAIQEVVIEGRAVKAKESYMERRKINASTTLDFISAETMKKTGDANVTSAVARVSGVSTSGAFITVRGIGDRYVKTMINGSRIPTLDPFTNNIKLDIFPASLVDNVLISKTASPDVPGDWAGAYLSIETKDYPEKLAVNIETSIGYNAQTTFKEVVSSKRSKTDWLGYDDGVRNYNHNQFVAVNREPSNYDVLVENGLANFYNELGVTKKTPFNDTYFKLGLIQLGLLEKGFINDENAFKAAKEKFESGNYRDIAFRRINDNAAKAGQAFSNNWNTTKRVAPLNFTQSFSIGNQTKLFGRELGFIVGFRYGNTTQYDANSVANRTQFIQSSNKIITDTLNVNTRIIQMVSEENRAISGLINLAYKINSNNCVSLLFMPNFNGKNNVRNALDTVDRNNGQGENFIIKNQFYEQRRQLVYQYKSEHYLPGPKIKMELNASYAKGKSSAPDFKNLRFQHTLSNNIYQIGGTFVRERFYRYLDESILDARFFAEMPISSNPDLLRKVKVGASYIENTRDYSQYNYIVETFGDDDFILGNGSDLPDIDAYFGPSKYQVNTVNLPDRVKTFVKQTYSNQGNESDLPGNFTVGNSKIASGFAMLDYTIFAPLRMAGGLRLEQSYLYTDVKLYDSLGIAENDTRRIAKLATINNLDFLPSLNVIYKLKKDELAPINLRFNYSKTLARPSLREISPLVVFDYEFQANVKGNPQLKQVTIDNYDFRIESYFKNGDNLSFSLFHKNFKNHIEIGLVGSSLFAQFSWQNAAKSTVSGIELEGRKKIYKGLDFRANVTFVKSETNVLDVIDTLKSISRAMLGQSPYVLNGILSYAFDSIGLNCALSYNVQGPRLVLISTAGTPNVFELPRHLLDFKVSKTLGKHFAASITVRDILNSPIRRQFDKKYKTPDNETVDFDKFRYGTSYQLSISYRL